MANKNKDTIPPSREVRLAGQELHGDAERIAWAIYKGDAGTLGRSIERLDLIIEMKRSKAVEAFKFLLRQQLAAEGYLVADDLDRIAEAWHQGEVDGDTDSLCYLTDDRPEVA